MPASGASWDCYSADAVRPLWYRRGGRPARLVRHQVPDARHPVGLGAFQLLGEPFCFRITPGFGDELQKQIPCGPCFAFCSAPCFALSLALGLALLEPVLQRLWQMCT